MKKKVLLGSWITLGHFSIAEIMAEGGFDWLCVDLEHTVVDLLEAEQLIATIQSKGSQAFVRVGENNARIIKRVLDAGADGIIVPMVNTVQDAKKAVEATKYPPVGTRGVGLARAQGYGFGFPEYYSQAKNIKLVVQIEHVDGISNLESILGVEGVDGTFIGPYDLSASMGKAGQYNDADVKNVISQYEEITSRYDKWVGFHVIQPDYLLVRDRIKAGYNFIAFSLDTIFLGSIIRQQLSSLQSLLK